ncbi:(2Fe-2S) ferredoxin domain-containing protein [Candidatus Pacearchaeota archaeon]|nr:(2Fe-2S) ferredoxin domain-containing protein [Candidatus Pacearchaeota archaeon]
MKYTISICQGTNCQNFLSEDLFKHAKKLTVGNPDIEIEKRHCMSLCNKAPNLTVVNEEGEKEIHSEIDYQKIEALIRELKEG